MSQFRIMENRLFETSVTVTGSTENNNFPATNQTHPFRSKVWRSNARGQFIITAGDNDKIDFVDSGGTLVATLAAATYSADTLATEIKTKMEAVSGDTFTISYSTSTGLWTLSSGGTTFELLNSSGANSADSVLVNSLGFASSDLTGSLSYTAPVVAIHTEESLLVDLSTTEEVDSVAVVFDCDTASKLTSTAEVRIQANPSTNFTSPSVDVLLTFDSDHNVFTHFFTSDQSYRYWRLQIKDPTNPNLYIEINKLVLSEATQLSQTPNSGFKYNLRDSSKVNQNEFGNVFADTFPTRHTLEFEYKFLPVADLEILFQIYERVGIIQPLCIALDPSATLFDKDLFFVYGRFTGALTSTQSFTNIFDTGSLKFEETC